MIPLFYFTDRPAKMASKKTGWNGPPFKKSPVAVADQSPSGSGLLNRAATEEVIAPADEDPEKMNFSFDLPSSLLAATDEEDKDEFSDGQEEREREERGNIFKKHFNAFMKKRGAKSQSSGSESEDDKFDQLFQPGKKLTKRMKTSSREEKENISPESKEKSEKAARGLSGLNTCEWFVLLKRGIQVMKTEEIDFETISFSGEILTPLLEDGKIMKRGWENVPNKAYHIKKKLKGLLVEFLKKKSIQRDFLVQFDNQQDHKLLELLFEDLLRLDRENKNKPRMKRLPLKGVGGAGEHCTRDILVPKNKELVGGRQNRELASKILAENSKTLGPVDNFDADGGIDQDPVDGINDVEGDTGAGAGDRGAGNEEGRKHFDIAMGGAVPQRRSVAPSKSKNSIDVNSILRQSEENMSRTEGIYKELEKNKEERHKELLEDSRMRTLTLAKLVETKTPAKFINIFHDGNLFAYSLKLGDLEQIVSETLGYLKEPETSVTAVLYHYSGNRPVIVSDPVVLSREDSQDEEVKVSLVTKDTEKYLQFCYKCNCDNEGRD